MGVLQTHRGQRLNALEIPLSDEGGIGGGLSFAYCNWAAGKVSRCFVPPSFKWCWLRNQFLYGEYAFAIIFFWPMF